MRIRFERDESQFVTIGSVEGRPEAVREFPDVEHPLTRLPTSLVDAWIKELKEYLGEEVESITLV